MEAMIEEVPSGVLVVDKDSGMTSHDLVAITRRQLNFKKIGHCGTLDPMATGVMMLVIGKATKLQDRLMSEDKVYDGSLKLGETTGSQDKESDIEEVREVPAYSDVEIKEGFEHFVGDFEQIPPMVSAIKKNGVPLYKLARQGKTVERKPRAVRVMDYQIHRVGLPEVDFTVHCTKGFYVRTYAHDIGQQLGCGAHLIALRRTRSGKFDLSRAIKTEDLKVASRQEIIDKMIKLDEIAEMLS
ncbi:tRNA pseudouridine(55) synthase TruB [Rubritalea tangerina]|uniref:tRNA pseudouridine synthase B n=2 Tax=Rubritalea tangerina TaxID=430798 RepID=A0ABW4ZBI4_9BACT